MRRIAIPVLILWGGRDRLIPPADGAAFAAAIADSRLVLWDHRGHVPEEKDARRTVAEVARFLAR